MRTLALVDGEHYPGDARGARRRRGARARGRAALLVGGTRSSRRGGLPDLGRPGSAWRPRIGWSRYAGRRGPGPGGDPDLSDEPVLGYRERMELASVALAARIPTSGRTSASTSGGRPTAAGPDPRGRGRASAPARPRSPGPWPGWRLAAASSRSSWRWAAADRRKTLAPAGSIRSRHLVRLVAEGERGLRLSRGRRDHRRDHRGARRAGGGLAGAPYTPTSGRPPTSRPPSILGSSSWRGPGRPVPPVPWDAAVLVVPATAPAEYLRGYLGPYRLLRSDLVVVTMASDPGSENLSALRSLFGAT